jgi:hypothetical protein
LSRTSTYSDCLVGIGEIERLAQTQQLEILRSDRHSQVFGNLILEDSEKIELLTRVMVRSRFIEVLSGRLERSLLELLKDVFFNIVYLTPP